MRALRLTVGVVAIAVLTGCGSTSSESTGAASTRAMTTRSATAAVDPTAEQGEMPDTAEAEDGSALPTAAPGASLATVDEKVTVLSSKCDQDSLPNAMSNPAMATDDSAPEYVAYVPKKPKKLCVLRYTVMNTSSSPIDGPDTFQTLHAGSTTYAQVDGDEAITTDLNDRQYEVSGSTLNPHDSVTYTAVWSVPAGTKATAYTLHPIEMAASPLGVAEVD